MNDLSLIRSLMDKPEHIRNVTFIAHVDHGKSTLTDALIIAPNACLYTINQDQNENNNNNSNVSIQSSVIPLFFKVPADSSFPKNADSPDFLINIISAPGAVVLVDVVEGVCVQTESLFRQSLLERVVPVAIINKLDRAILELQLSSEEIYQHLYRIIDNLNVIEATFYDQSLGDISFKPEKLNIAFTSGLHGWGFTLKQFAVVYADKFGVDEEKMIQRLWGDHYFDPEEKKWTSQPVSASGKTLSRAFCKFILDPIMQMCNSVMNDNMDRVQKMLNALKIHLTDEEHSLSGKSKLKAILRKWLPVSQVVLEMMVQHLPSPAQAQKYRVETLYTGPQDDITATSIRECNPNGPLVVHIFKMAPTSERGRFYAVGRVFSGTITSEQKVIILGPEYRNAMDFFNDNNKKLVKPIKDVMIPIGRKVLKVDYLSAGNFCCLSGIDQYVLKSATLVSDETSFPLAHSLPFVPKPSTRVTVEPENPADLPKLIEGLKWLTRVEMLVQVTFEESGALVLSSDSELLIEINLKEVEERFMGNRKIKISAPFVAYKETVTEESSQVCLVTSPNKHNRIYSMAAPLGEEVTEAIEKFDLNPLLSQKTISDKFIHFGWKEEEAQKIWCFGGPENMANVVVQMAKGVPNVNEIKDSVTAAFQWVTKEGVLAEEGLRGVRMNILDAVLHADAVHRGGGQIIPTARRAFYAAQLTAKPRFMEPVMLVEIQCPQTALGGVYTVVNKRKGIIIEETPRPGTPLYTVKAFLPSTETNGFTTDLRMNTGGQAFPQMIFDHWQVIPEDPLEEGTRANELLKEIRKRKGLPEEVRLDRFLN